MIVKAAIREFHEFLHSASSVSIANSNESFIESHSLVYLKEEQIIGTQSSFISSSSIQFQSVFSLVTEGDHIHLIPSAIALTTSLHLVRSAASSIFNPTSFTHSSTCLLHVIFSRPRFRSPFTSIIFAFFSILLSSFLITCPYHLTPFTFSILSSFSFNPNISISSSIFFLPTNFTPHIDFTVGFARDRPGPRPWMPLFASVRLRPGRS